MTGNCSAFDGFASDVDVDDVDDNDDDDEMHQKQTAISNSCQCSIFNFATSANSAGRQVDRTDSLPSTGAAADASFSVDSWSTLSCDLVPA